MLEKSMFNIRQIFTSIADVGQKIFRRKELKKLKKLDSILTLSDDLLSNKGAAFGITVARYITDLYQILSNEDKAIAGFEKSGHFFFNKPLGYGYDDGINSAIQVCKLIDNQNKNLNQMIDELPSTFQSPTMGPFCKDDEKYDVIEKLILKIKELKSQEFKIDSLKIKNILTVNGIRFTLEDGSWGLVRASSNKPSLVVVTESPVSDKRKKEIFYFIDKLLQETGKVGEYDQKI